MPEAVFVSIRGRAAAEGARAAIVQGYALRTSLGRAVTLTVAPPRPVVTAHPFADIFHTLGLSWEGV